MTDPNSAPFQDVMTRLRRVRRLSALAGAAGFAALIVLWIVVLVLAPRWPLGAASFFKAYLFAWLFFLGISLGAMSAIMIDHLIGSQWGWFVRRFGEAAANVLPLLFILFIPLLFGLHHLYAWADPERHDPAVAHQRPWLNTPSFIVRYLIYFAVWISIAWRLRRLSLRQDHEPSTRTQSQMYSLSAAGLVIYFIAMSLASVDWIMALEPGWHSTVFGFIVCMSQSVTGAAVLIITLIVLSGMEPFAGRLKPRHLNDLGSLLMTAVVLWAYNSFSQFLVIWMTNIQNEIPWYFKRSYGAWRVMSALLIFVGFLTPFVILLQRAAKQSKRVMLYICGGLLLMQLLYDYWVIAPSGDDPYPPLHWFNVLMSLVAVVGIGGLWLAAYLWLLDGQPLATRVNAVAIGEHPTPRTLGETRKLEHGADDARQPDIA